MFRLLTVIYDDIYFLELIIAAFDFICSIEIFELCQYESLKSKNHSFLSHLDCLYDIYFLEFIIAPFDFICWNEIFQLWQCDSLKSKIHSFLSYLEWLLWNKYVQSSILILLHWSAHLIFLMQYCKGDICFKILNSFFSFNSYFVLLYSLYLCCFSFYLRWWNLLENCTKVNKLSNCNNFRSSWLPFQVVILSLSSNPSSTLIKANLFFNKSKRDMLILN